MNWLDVFIIAFLLAALIRGTEVGFVRQFFSTVGFFLGLFFGAWLHHWLLPLVQAPTKRVLLALFATLGIAFGLMVVGEYVGLRLKFKLQERRIGDRLDRILGAALGAVTILAAIWLSAAIFRNLPDGLWQRQIRGSRIVASLDNSLPAAPNLLTELGHLLDPNGFPQVFTGREPQPIDAPLPDMGALNEGVQKAKASVVKIEGKGCGGVVEGSGFVAANGLVVTNAHVVAGVRHPFINDSKGEHRAIVVWFDANLDIAVLKAGNLAGTPLTMSGAIAVNGTPFASLGFPSGGGLTASPGTILDSFTAVGRNIYNQDRTEREVYSIKNDVQEGDSGGPLIDKEGAVIGVVFAKSTSYDQVGYALTMQAVIDSVNAAQDSSDAVNTGSCAQ